MHYGDGCEYDLIFIRTRLVPHYKCILTRLVNDLETTLRLLTYNFSHFLVIMSVVNRTAFDYRTTFYRLLEILSCFNDLEIPGHIL